MAKKYQGPENRKKKRREDDQMCSDCPKELHADQLSEVKEELGAVKTQAAILETTNSKWHIRTNKKQNKVIGAIIVGAISICGTLITATNILHGDYLISNNNVIKVYEEKSEFTKQAGEALSTLKALTVKVSDYEYRQSEFLNQQYARRQNEDFIMKELIEIRSELENQSKEKRR